jgi:hypothetical protein
VDSQMPPRGKVDIWRQSGKMAAVKGLPTASSLAGDLDANLTRGSSVFKSPRKKGRFGKGYTAQGSRRPPNQGHLVMARLEASTRPVRAL